jgi:hypothetical protein
MGGVKGWVSKSCFLGERRWRAFAKIRDFFYTGYGYWLSLVQLQWVANVCVHVSNSKKMSTHSTLLHKLSGGRVRAGARRRGGACQQQHRRTHSTAHSRYRRQASSSAADSSSRASETIVGPSDRLYSSSIYFLHTYLLVCFGSVPPCDGVRRS